MSNIKILAYQARAEALVQLPQFEAIVRSAAQSLNLNYTVDVKSVDSILIKLRRKSSAVTPLALHDLLRATIFLSSDYRELLVLISNFTSLPGYQLQTSVMGPNNLWGYRGVSSNFKVGPIWAEVQYHTPESFHSKKTHSDPIYAQWRNYEVGSELQIPATLKPVLAADVRRSKRLWTTWYRHLPPQAKINLEELAMYYPSYANPQKNPMTDVDRRWYHDVVMPYFQIRVVRFAWSSSLKKWPDLWMEPGPIPTITVTREWARQKLDERRKRLVHESLHLVGMQHDESIGYSTHPERDTFSMRVYHQILAGHPWRSHK